MTQPHEDLIGAIAARVTFSDCWVWNGAKNNYGYGSIRVRQKGHLVHRLVWELLVGPIPTGLQMDHLCRNRSCCNPDHLEPVTHAENVARGMKRRSATCKNGHVFDMDVVRPNGWIEHRCSTGERAKRAARTALLRASRAA